MSAFDPRSPRHGRTPVPAHALPRRAQRPGRSRAVAALTALVLTFVTVVGVSRLSAFGAPLASPGAGPTTIYAAGSAPSGRDLGDHASVELGVSFSVTRPGTIVAIRFYKAGPTSIGSTATLWTNNGTRLASGQFGAESAVGWQRLRLATPVAVRPGMSYVASYHAPHGQYAQTVGEFAGARQSGNALIHASAGLYSYGALSRFPTSSWHDTGYGVDVRFVPGGSGGSAPSPPSSSAPSSSAPTSSAPTSSAPTSSAPTSAPTSGATAPPTGAPMAGYPNADTTGVPDGTHLIDVPGSVRSGPGWTWDNRGWVSLTGAGATFSGYRVQGTVEVYGVGASVTDNDIEASGAGWAVGLRPSASDVTVSHNDIHGPCLVCADRLTYGIDGDLGGDAGSQILSNNLYDIDHPLQQERGLVKDNYVHGLATNGTTDHVDAFFSGGGTTEQLTLEHNTLLNDYTGDGTTASIILSNAFGTQSNRLIEDNFIAGGGYALYGGNAVKGTNVIIRDNRFSTVFFSKCGYYGPVTAIQTGAGNSFTGNVWADGPNAGKTIIP